MKKKDIAKIVVNSLTLSRIAGTICLPFVFTMCSAFSFILFISAILFTDFLDGFIARKYDVCTIFGSIADMTADKIFGISLLFSITTFYKIMFIPLILEILIATVNINNVKNGGLAKSSQIGRIKMWIMGLSICSLLIVGLSPELNKSLNSINISEISNTFKNTFHNMGSFINKIFDNKQVVESFKNFGVNIDNSIQNIKVDLKNSVLIGLDKIDKNKEAIKATSEIAAISSELIVLKSYLLEKINNSKTKKSNKEIIEELKTNKEFIKKIMFDEQYYKQTKDEPLIKKLTNNVDKN